MTRGRGWPIVILAGLVILLVFVVLMPAVELFAEQSDAVAQAQSDFAAYRAQIAAAPRLKAELASARQQEAATASLVTGDSTALAAANLQAIVKALVERHGGQLRSAQTLSSAAADGREKIVVQDEVSLPAGALKPATYDIETGTPYLFLDAVDIRPEAYAGDAAQAPGALHVQWTIHAYRRVATP